MRGLRFWMLITIAVPAAAVAAGGKQWPMGWSYDPNPLWPGAIYRFDDRAGSMLGLRCHSGPVAILRGDFPFGARMFELSVDGHTKRLPISRGTEGGGLIVEDPRTVDRMATTRRAMIFRVATWYRKVPPSPLVGKFLRDCRRLRQKYPGH